MTLITSIASQKGGTSKTTTSISLAAGLARQGHSTLLIDIDSQANSSKVLLPKYQDLKKHETLYSTILERKPVQIHPTNVPNLDLVPSHILLSNTDVELTTAIDHREARLKDQLDSIKDRYEYIFIDCPPALSWLTLNAFTASDQVVIVIAPGYFELESVLQIMKTIYEVQQNFNKALKIRGLLFAMADVTTNSKTSLRVLRQAYPEYVLNTVIPRNVALKDASMKQMDIFEYDPKSIGAEAYDRLIKEITNGA